MNQRQPKNQSLLFIIKAKLKRYQNTTGFDLQEKLFLLARITAMLHYDRHKQLRYSTTVLQLLYRTAIFSR